mmetsp:Transcript_19532/g.25303  ORF Transcript_19532/g.25303 Transcript_19532/m.25303 type:complete len:749 (+) Transcript_19532:215-2461(+)
MSSNDKVSINKALELWQKFDLVGQHIPNLDQAVAQSKEKHKESQTNRRQLAEITKKFKRAGKSALEAASKLEDNGPIKELQTEGRNAVKAYQEEIDNLTRRCKAAEGANLVLYKGLCELPDPAHLFQKAVNYVSDLENQLESQVNQNATLMEKQLHQKDNSKIVGRLQKEIDELKGKAREDASERVRLETELEEFEVEFKSLKNQEITIRHLEEQIETLKLEKNDSINSEVKKAQEDLIESEGQKLIEVLERCSELTIALESAQLELKAERAGKRTTQVNLLQAEEGTAELEAAWDAQRQILMDDNERLRERLFETTQERDGLKLKMAAVETSGASVSKNNNLSPEQESGQYMAAYEAEIQELTLSASSLREELRLKDQSLKEVSKSSEQNAQRLNEEIEKFRVLNMNLRDQLACAPSVESVEQMKRELRILKRLEYNLADDEDDNEPERVEDVESILVSRLKKMEDALMREKRSVEEAEENAKKLENELKEKIHEKENAENLVKNLESDLNRALADSVKQASAQATKEDSNVAPAVNTSEGQANTLDAILDGREAPPSPPKPSIEKKYQEDDHSVATIVMAQRDRLRVRCDALEAERDGFKRELQMQVLTSESLKSDNSKLYEKVKYLQNFRVNKTDRDLDLEALEQRYEDSVDPFKQFSKAERKRKLNQMSPIERIVYMFARQLLGTKQMRTALFCYIVGMHFLVFVTTFHWSHYATSCDFSDHHMVDHLHHAPPKIEKFVGDVVE